MIQKWVWGLKIVNNLSPPPLPRVTEQHPGLPLEMHDGQPNLKLDIE